MSAKRKILKVNPFDDIHVIGINTPYKDYKLAWYLNETIKTDFRKHDDIAFEDELGEVAGFPFYYFNAGENQHVYNLIGNKSNGKLFGRLSIRTDFLLIIRNPMDEERLSAIIGQIKSIPNIVMVFHVDTGKEKFIDLMLEAIELHEFRTMKQVKARLPRQPIGRRLQKPVD
jgi:hypothetical protein